MTQFEPIAIVGQACELPGASSPDELYRAVREKKDLLSRVPPDRWGVPQTDILGAVGESADRTFCDRGGYVEGFDARFDPSGFAVSAESIMQYDRLFRWLLHVGREAMRDAGIEDGSRVGSIVGNLSFPAESLARYGERLWLGDTLADAAELPNVAPENCFMSGQPAHLLARALGLGGGAFCLDAACASSLVAIKLACDRLHAREVDSMLAGAVCCADDLFVHVGFCALQAMSPAGSSRPFHAGADGLVPAEGAGMVVLERLSDAVAKGRRILGVVRGIGLSNDGRAKGLLAPSSEGQVRALERAYAVAGLDPKSVDYVECHATGTPVGDGTELRSMLATFGSEQRLPIGSLKSNLGHPITAAGVAGLVKVLMAMRAGELPPTIHLDEEPQNRTLAETPFEVVTEPRPWPRREMQRRAAVSAFGFGGNNAHLIVDEYLPSADYGQVPGAADLAKARNEEAIAVVAVSVLRPEGTVDLGSEALRFPPTDLAQALPQQILMLEAARAALAQLPLLDPQATGVMIGMGCDPDVARYGARWRLPGWARDWGVNDSAWVDEAQSAFVSPLQAAGVLGTMPNIVANRINSAFDFGGESLTVSSEELSGIDALRAARRSLLRGDISAALVGAVDRSSNPVQHHALRALGCDRAPADVAVAFVLETLEEAKKRNHRVLAHIAFDEDVPASGEAPIATVAHAAHGLEQVAQCIKAGDDLNLELSTLLHHQRRRLQIQIVESLVAVQSEVETVKSDKPLRGFRMELGNKEVQLPPWPEQRPDLCEPLQPGDEVVTMAPAPALPPLVSPEEPVQQEVGSAMAAVAVASVGGNPNPAATSTDPVQAARTAQASSVAQTAAAHSPAVAQMLPGQVATALVHQAVQTRGQLAAMHQQFLAQQSQVHEQFLALRGRMQSSMLDSVRSLPPMPAVSIPPRQQEPAVPQQPAFPTAAAATTAVAETPQPVTLPGFSLDREGLKVHASGAISSIFGEALKAQDGYVRQVRMPEPPLLLADRMTGIDAEVGSMGLGRIWTETDVLEDSWYLHQHRMPAGIMIESGQADLMLISYLGVDLLNQSDRVYRLLGCELTYHGSLPKPGETLCYDIHVDGHANQGDVRLFFFHYDCVVAGEPRLTVRHGQAGFFNDEELANSAGVLWDANDAEHCDNPRLAPPPQLSTCRAFSAEQLAAFSRGDVRGCFGEGFDYGETHTRTPRIAAGRMSFLDEVTHFEPEGGPWGRGYLRGVDTIEEDDWFFEGHFKNDPCMPGTLMFEGCLQAMAIYMTALGFTLPRDGWRFEPVPDEPYQLRCRGQVLPHSKDLVYEVFIEEVVAEPYPTIYADLLCTIDGRKAFHCRRMGLRLVPDWPLDQLLHERPELLEPAQRPGPVATIDGFDFDYMSLLACAWGRPSLAFGDMYRVFDGHRKVARLPGPPYHFMTRVAEIDGQIGVVEANQHVVIDYDIPADAWYFDETPSMPYAVLLEAALQPCGWLASFVGSATTTDINLCFRNLDGTATLHTELWPTSGTLRTRVHLNSISQTAGMIIQNFKVECTFVETGEKVYDMSTVFGFFPEEAFVNQVGLPIPEHEQGAVDAVTELCIELGERPKRLFDAGPRMPEGQLLMLDRISGYWPEGGCAGKGRYRGEKDVIADAWFFKAHFFQDPVQPGSLGIEAMIQLLQLAMLDRGMAQGFKNARFEPIALGKAMTWKYRGQVVPKNDVITTLVDIVEEGEDDAGRYAIANASLYVDGKRIYEAKNMAMRLVGERQAPEAEEVLDPEKDLWLADHCPTYTLPALPMMSMVDRLAAATCQHHGEGKVVAIRDLQLHRWLVLQGPTRLRCSVESTDEAGVYRSSLLAFREASRSELSRFEVVAEATVAMASSYGPVPAAWPGCEAPSVELPYDDGALFHGLAFQKLVALRRNESGAWGRLRAEPGEVPVGHLNQVLLDAATHLIPHDALDLWCPDIPADRVAYPYRIEQMELFGVAPTVGEVTCSARFAGMASERLVRFELEMHYQAKVWMRATLVEIVLPKGPIGQAAGVERKRFLADREYVEGVSLAQHNGDTTRLRLEDIKASNWLPGTLESLYSLDAAASTEAGSKSLAAKSHAAHCLQLHPSLVGYEDGSYFVRARPIQRTPVAWEPREGGLQLRTAGPRRLDIAPAKRYWSKHFGVGRWPVEDIYYGLIERFIHDLHLSDADNFEALRGKSVLYLANHQTAIESLLFSILVSGLSQTPTVTLAKAEHRDTWLGRMIQHCFRYPGVVDPKVITYFDRSDPESLGAIIEQLAAEMMGPGKSVMVHIEGTRAFTCRELVRKMTSKFIDMSIATGAPIVPVRFSGGLPVEALTERTEFPVAMGKQAIHIGKAIEPAELAALPYKERKPKVLEAINSLGPSANSETPIPGDEALARAVAERVLRTGASAEHATLLEVLSRRDSIHPELAALLRGDTDGHLLVADADSERWLAELAQRLYGPRGAKVATLDES